MKLTITDNSFTDKLCADVDKLADDARAKVVGDPVRIEEYREAEIQARAFAAAGFQGEPGQFVSDWAIPKGWTNQQAAEDIIQAANRWRGALAGIRQMRLATKEAIKRATTAMAKEAIFNQFQEALIAAMVGVS